ncbi:MAG: hypothetical protein AAF962_27780, partial [Actinomycetota bacterium]
MLVMLDLDNTLADRAAAVAAWLDEFSVEHNLSPDDRTWILGLDNDGYSDRRQVFTAIKRRFDLDAPAEHLQATYQQRVVELAVLTDGAADCLRLMRRRVAGATEPLRQARLGRGGQPLGRLGRHREPQRRIDGLELDQGDLVTDDDVDPGVEQGLGPGG